MSLSKITLFTHLFQGFETGLLKIMGKNIITDKDNYVSSYHFLTTCHIMCLLCHYVTVPSNVAIYLMFSNISQY